MNTNKPLLLDALAALWASFPAELRPSLLDVLYHCEVA